MAVYNEIGIGRWNRFAIGLSVGPIAAQQSGVRLTIPSNLNVILVLEKAAITVAAATFANLEYGRVGAGLSNAAASIPMETRGRAASTGLVSFNAAALTTLNVVSQLNILANTPYEFLPDSGHEISIPPGASVQLDENLVNTQI